MKIYQWLLTILFIDFLCFMAWIISGQSPEGIYLGMITGNIIKLIK